MADNNMWLEKPAGFDEAQSIMGDGFPRLPAGGYVCKILNVQNGFSSKGAPMLTLAIDVAEGEYANFFRQQFDAKMKANPDTKWPCCYYQLTEGNSVGRFKGMLEAIALSNAGWQWGWPLNLNDLKGKIFGGKFGEEEYEGRDGNVYMSTKCLAILPREGIEDIVPPEPKLLNKAKPQETGYSVSSTIPEDEIPF